jgi:RimJ/RimL family protein N-acetyltransferase
VAHAVNVLQTERLTLRPFEESDFEAYAEMCADPEVMRYLSATGAILSREDAWRQLALFAGHWSLRGFGMWALVERETGEFVGRAGLHFPEGWPAREVGWTLRRKSWGKGYATEAARAAARHAFDVLGWPSLISLVHPENQRSARVAERLGMRLDRLADFRGTLHCFYRMDQSTFRQD